MFHPVLLFQILAFVAIFSLIALLVFLRCVQVSLENGVYVFRKSVKPNYWGAYQGALAKDLPPDAEIELPKPASFTDAVSGSSRYASGKAVRSARG